MHKRTEAFLEKMKNDEKFAEKVLSQTEMDKVIGVAAVEGLELTLADLEEATAVITKMTGSAKVNDGELTEEEMERIAGGFGTCKPWLWS